MAIAARHYIIHALLPHAFMSSESLEHGALSMNLQKY
jgi:hypothetical protein